MRNIVYGGVTASVFNLQVGQTIPRHQHPVPHTTSVITGRSRVEVFDGRPPIEVDRHTPLIELPPLIDHEITALENTTVIINMIVGEYDINTDPPETYGGVLMADGTIVR
jgi:quercetin dioxygenase-like cupin family protein